MTVAGLAKHPEFRGYFVCAAASVSSTASGSSSTELLRLLIAVITAKKPF
jgi:hypothetical protein